MTPCKKAAATFAIARLRQAGQKSSALRSAAEAPLKSRPSFGQSRRDCWSRPRDPESGVLPRPRMTCRGLPTSRATFAPSSGYICLLRGRGFPHAHVENGGLFCSCATSEEYMDVIENVFLFELAFFSFPYFCLFPWQYTCMFSRI